MGPLASMGAEGARLVPDRYLGSSLLGLERNRGLVLTRTALRHVSHFPS